MRGKMEKYFNNREEWRRWLEENYSISGELWMIMYKKHTGIKCIAYNDAVEEALCFGWIDGKIKRINDEYYIQRYSRRKRNSRWSKYNIERVKKLLEENKMMEAGIEAYNEIFRNPALVYDNRSSGNVIIPDDLLDILGKNRTAVENFQKFPESSKRIYVDWINSAKMDETRMRRILKVISACEKNQRPGMI